MTLPSFVGILKDGPTDLAARAKQIARGQDVTEEIVSVELSYSELWALLESGTVSKDSQLWSKLSAARAAFERSPKVYGKGLAIRVKETA